MGDKNISAVGVLGGGSWGTAIAGALQDNGYFVNWWMRRDNQIEKIYRNGLNPDYLKHKHLNTDKLYLSSSLHDIVTKSDTIFLAIPSAYIQDAISTNNYCILSERNIISAVKGLMPKSGKLVHHWLIEDVGVNTKNLGVIGGPGHSEEISTRQLSYLTIGVTNNALGVKVSKMISSPFINVILSDDIEGISMAGVFKNIYGILAGIAYGLRYGDNFIAVLISNALKEMEQVLFNITGKTRAIQNSAYGGDLLVTAYPGLSRNWMLGNLIGKGYSVNKALPELKMVAEGYYASKALAKNKHFSYGNYPLLKATYDILHGNILPQPAFQELSKKLY